MPWGYIKLGQKLRKLIIGREMACFPECHDQSEPTVELIKDEQMDQQQSDRQIHG